jgi:queuine tRNA-ribosyltransferase
MPVGTQGTVKAVSPRELNEISANIILSNTYHLYLRPGTSVLESVGGLHRFMGWNGPILTDSGGYQVYSLSELRKLKEDGVEFKSHLDGSLHHFSPESVIETQRSIGSDIMMVLDECPPHPCEYEYAERSNALTMRWAARCREHAGRTAPRYGHNQALFGIVQGSIFPDLRERSARELISLDLDGYAIGGLAVGEAAASMYAMTALCCSILPADKPRYLMGVGTPENILESIERGVDMFDCVLPTRNGRNASFFTRNGTLNILNARFKTDASPVDPECACGSCSVFSRAYIRHLFVSREILALRLATIHNLYFYQWLLRGARTAIVNGTYAVWKNEVLRRMNVQETTTQHISS